MGAANQQTWPCAESSAQNLHGLYARVAILCGSAITVVHEQSRRSDLAGRTLLGVEHIYSSFHLDDCLELL